METGEDLRPGEKRVDHSFLQFGLAGVPRDYPLDRAEATLQYGFVKIDQRTYLLPASGENIGCMSGSGACTRNAIEFRNYRKFTTESNITFGK